MPKHDTNLSWTDDRTPLSDDAKALRLALDQYEEFAKTVALEVRPSSSGDSLHYLAANTIIDVRRIASGLPQKDRAEMTPPIPLT